MECLSLVNSTHGCIFLALQTEQSPARTGAQSTTAEQHEC